MSTGAIPAPAAAKEKTRRQLGKELTKGIIVENPILIIMLGLCATLACSTSATDALGMGTAFSFVMICSNVVVSPVRRITPHQIRIPVFITVISTFVTIVDYAMMAYTPLLSRSLGVFVPLIVVNCILMGRAEAFASRSAVAESFMDGIGIARRQPGRQRERQRLPRPGGSAQHRASELRHGAGEPNRVADLVDQQHRPARPASSRT